LTLLHAIAPNASRRAVRARACRRAARVGAAAWLALGLLAVQAAPATDARAQDQGQSDGPGAPTLAALADCLAKDGRVEVPFREERLVQSIDRMLESTGRLIYEPPDTLIQQVEAPKQERAVVEGDRMSVFDASGAEVATFDLAQRPALKALFDAVRALIQGDAGALRETFEVSVNARETEAGAGWGMTLKPTAEEVEYELSRILIDGTGRPGADAACEVATIDVRKRGGGRRVIHLRPGTS
jgi:hypothetical protein